jgi:ABC-type phosphate transport system auxiliary subunit
MCEGSSGSVRTKRATQKQVGAVSALRETLDMEQQQVDWVSAQAEELRAEREKWSAALEASHRQIVHLTHKEAELEKYTGSCPSTGLVSSPASEPQP